MASDLLSNNFLKSTWVVSRAPFYNKGDNRVYWVYHTQVSSFTTKELTDLSSGNRKNVIEAFKTLKLFTTNELILDPQTLTEVGYCGPESASATSNLLPLPEHITPERFYIAPRPGAKLKILYSIPAKYINLKKVEYLRARENAEFLKPPRKPRFGQDGWWETSNKDLQDDLLKGVGKIDELNKYFKRKLSTNQKYISKTAGILGRFQNPPETAADNLARMSSARNPSTLAGNYNESLQAVDFVGDFFFDQMPDFLGDVEEVVDDADYWIIDTSGTQEALKKAQNASAAAAKELNKIVVFLNKWGLTGLLECLIALTAEKLSLAGYIVVAQKLIEQAEELLESYKMFKAQLQEVDEMVAAFIARMMATQEFDLEEEIKEAFVGMLKEALRQIVQMALAACLEELASEQPASDFDFGALSPGESFGQSFNTSPYDPSNSFDVALNRDLGVTLAQMGDGGDENQKNNIKRFIADVFETLTPKELCRLFLGSPEPKLVAFVFSFAENYKYPKFKGYADVKSFFLALGKLSNLTICEDLMMAAPLAMGDPLYCDTGKLDPFTEQLRNKVPDDLLQNLSKQRNEDLLNTANLLEQFLSGEDPFASSYPSIEMGPFYDPIWTRIKKVIPTWEGVFNEDLKGLGKLADANPTVGIKQGAQAIAKAFPDADSPSLDQGELKKLQANPQVKALALVDKLPPLPSMESVIGQSVFLKNSSLNHANSSMILDFDNFQVETFRDAKQKQHKKYIMADAGLKKLAEKEKLAKDGAVFDTNAVPVKGQWPDSLLNISNVLKESMKGTPHEDAFLKGFVNQPAAMDKVWWETCFAIYKDIYFQIYKEAIEGFYKKYDKQPSVSSILKSLPYFGKDRIDHLQKKLCDLKESKEQSNKVLYNEDYLLDLEALKSLVYVFMIENSLPIFLAEEMIPYDSSFAMVETQEIVPEFKKFIKNHNLIIPFNQILCDSVDSNGNKLTVEKLVLDETKLIKSRLSGEKGYASAKGSPQPPADWVKSRLKNLGGLIFLTGGQVGDPFKMTVNPQTLGAQATNPINAKIPPGTQPLYKGDLQSSNYKKPEIQTFYLHDMVWHNPYGKEKLGFFDWMVSLYNPVWRDWDKVLKSPQHEAMSKQWQDAGNIILAFTSLVPPKPPADSNTLSESLSVEFDVADENLNLVYWFLIKSLNIFLKDLFEQKNTFFSTEDSAFISKSTGKKINEVKWTNPIGTVAGNDIVPEMLTNFGINFKQYVTLKTLGQYNEYKLAHTKLGPLWNFGSGDLFHKFFTNVLVGADDSIIVQAPVGGDSVRLFSKEADIIFEPPTHSTNVVFKGKDEVWLKWHLATKEYYAYYMGSSGNSHLWPEEVFKGNANINATDVKSMQAPLSSNYPSVSIVSAPNTPPPPTLAPSFDANEMATAIKLETFDALNDVFTKEQKLNIFQKFKATLVEFIGGIPFNKENAYGATKDQLKFALNELKMGAGSLSLEMNSTPLWIMILMLIPKIIIAGIKSIIETYLFMQVPIVYFLLKTLESLGLDLAGSDEADLLGAADTYLKGKEKEMASDQAAKYPQSAAAQQFKKQQQLEKLKCPLP